VRRQPRVEGERLAVGELHPDRAVAIDERADLEVQVVVSTRREGRGRCVRMIHPMSCAVIASRVQLRICAIAIEGKYFSGPAYRTDAP